jgi:signal transduction histidine kinase
MSADQLNPAPDSSKLLQNFSALQRQSKRLARILEISQQLTSTLELEPLLQQIIQSAAELTDTESASIMLYDEKAEELRFSAVTGSKSDQLPKLRVPIEGSIAGAIWKSGEPLIIPDVEQDPRHYQRTDQTIQFRTRNLLGVPLSIKDHRIGVLEAINKRGDAPFTDEDTQVLGALAAQAAIAIQNAQLVGALQQAYQKLNQLDKIKNDFIAIASHELRTPLGLILGYATMLKDDASGPAAKQLEVVLNAALRLRGLIDEMVNLRHLDTGELKLELGVFPIQDVVKAVCAENERLATAKSQTVTQNLPADPLLIRADRARVIIVLTNLINNAIRFTPDGGKISIGAQTRNDQVWVTVTDNGIGIPAGDLERIFERFYQVEPHMSRHHGGLGLGLAIAKGMVEALDGRIWAESVLGKGSRFTFTLDRGEPAA